MTKTIDDSYARHLKRKFRIVHASVGLTGYGCPPEMIRLAVSINPHQIREMDEEGNLVSCSFALVSLHGMFLSYLTSIPRSLST